METVGFFYFILGWILFLVVPLREDAQYQQETTSTILLNEETKAKTHIFFPDDSFHTEIRADPKILNFIYNLDDVTVPHYGENPCYPFKPEMPDFRAPGRRISEVKCFENIWNMKFEQQEIKRDIECMILKKRRRLIAGGSDAEAGQYAHMAAVGWRAQEGSWVFLCGCSLISDKFLLTAAHCSRTSNRDTSVADPIPKIVRLGGHSIMDYDMDGLPATDVDIKRFISHPQYRPPRKYYDIALIEMVKPVRFEWMVHPACLGSDMNLMSNVPATVTGWGVVDLATLRTAPVLQVATIDLMESTECDKRLQFGRNRNFRGVVGHQMCAGYMAGGIDACRGDSGGPIQVKLNVTNVDPDSVPWYIHRVLGVTSFGYGCARANTPGVYTRVASFIDWIEHNVWPEASTH